MIGKTPPLGRSSHAAELVRQATSTRDAREKLEALVASVATELPSGFVKADGKKLDLADVDQTFVVTAGTEAKVAERRLQQSIRSLRRESEGRASPDALRVLANDALRLVVEAVAWRRLADLAASNLEPAKGPAVLSVRQSSAGALARIQQLHRFLTSDAPDRHRVLASLAFAKDVAPKTGGDAPASRLTEHETAALLDILQSKDPGRRDLVSERLASGESIDAVRDLLFERMLPVSLAQEKKPAADAKKDAGGLMFDLGTNTFVQRDLSWAYDISLGQLFDYEVDGICDGRHELVARLTAAATDPTSGELVGATEVAIEAFVADLAAAASAGDAAVDRLLGGRLTMCFSTTDFGSKPVSADWELPRTATADLFHAMNDPTFREHLGAVAGEARRLEATRKKEVLEPLADLLAQYDGKPRRHKRAHAALINLGLAGQSIQEMGREGGVLPRSKTLLDPQKLASEYADADHLKVRFLFTDEFELYVVSDQMFQEVVDKHHFPPNHELLSYNHPIAGSGYITIHQGRIVGLEDDIVMLPGKLPDNLPPALSVLELRGFPLDHDKIAESSRVLDWDAFGDLAKGKTAAPSAPAGSAAEIRDRLIGCAHGDRPGLVFAAIRGELEARRASGDDEPVAREKTEAFVKEILAGFQIINVAARDFRSGELPSHLNEFVELKIDDVLAPYLVRKVAAS